MGRCYLFFISICMVGIQSLAEPMIYPTQDLSHQGESRGAADLLSACTADPKKDLSCQKIIELNDFTRRFIEQILLYTELKKYEFILGTISGILVSQKITMQKRRGKHFWGVTYNLNSEVTSLSYSYSF